MKTFSSFAYLENAMLRFGCSVMSIASLTFVVFPAQAGQAQQGIRMGVQTTIIASSHCSISCAIRLQYCLAAKTDKNICYYNYSACLSGCTNSSWYSYLEPGCFLPKQS
jgi:hypothetical protein